MIRYMVGCKNVGRKGKKMRIRDMKLSDYDISQAKYNELKYFCMQYEEKKRALANGYGLRSVVQDGMPRGNSVGNPTEQRAIRNLMLKNDIELIEQTAKEAAPELYPYLLENVAGGMKYEYMDVPTGRRQFYEARRYFFYLLAQKR